MTGTRVLFFAAVAAALVVSTGSDAQAAFGDFNYSTLTSINGSVPTLVSVTNAGPTGPIVGGPATITLTGTSSTNIAGAGVGSDIILGSIVVTSTSGQPGTIGNVPYQFVVTITNRDNLGVGTVTVSGVLNGNATTNQVNVNNTYIAPFAPSTNAGGTLYTVNYTPGVSGGGSFTPPGANSVAGTFGAHVTAVPEPSSLALLGLGALSLLGVSRRRLRA